MKVIKFVGDSVVVRVSKQRAPDRSCLYGVILHYDRHKDYDDLDCDFYEATQRDAVDRASVWSR